MNIDADRNLVDLGLVIVCGFEARADFLMYVRILGDTPELL